MNLILLGAPGAGKGTLASYLIEQMGVPSISTGNILREAIKNNTPLGQSAKEYMDAGKLVPDEVVIGMLKERIAKRDCKSGLATSAAISWSSAAMIRLRSFVIVLKPTMSRPSRSRATMKPRASSRASMVLRASPLPKSLQ